jgi:catechol 2,3-dioxygenase-like lactoylglutathione lyase family enzyme
MAPPKIRWNYSGIRVQDLARSIRFYERLGFRAGKEGGMEHGGRFVDLHFPGSAHTIELNYYPTTNVYYEPFVAGTAFDHFGFTVDDIDGWVRRLRHWRIPLVADFSERGLRLVYVRDPDGNWLEFCGKVRTAPRARRRPA